MNIVFMGTPEFAVPCLQKLLDAGYPVTGVFTQPDKPKGRGYKLLPPPVKELALQHHIPVYQPATLKSDEAFAALQGCAPDLIVVVAYGKLLPERVLELPRYGCINVHASLLPKYRGAAPIQYALRNGDTTTGVTLMEMVKEMDAGDIYAQESLGIDPEDDYTSLSNRLAALALDMAVKYLPLYFDGKLQGRKQVESEATFCPTIKKEEEKLSLTQSPEAFVNAVRSLSQEPGGHLLLDEEPIKIFKARKVSDEKLAPAGTVLLARKKDIHLQLSEGIVALLELQRPGKKRLSAVDFNNGSHIEGKTFR